MIEEEETSQQMRVNEVANTKAQVQDDGTEREGANKSPSCLTKKR